MKIGIDAKRIFSNPTGLGVYGRNLVAGLSQLSSKNLYSLFTPSLSDKLVDYKTLPSNFNFVEKKGFSSYYWRTFSIKNSLQALNLDIYHGLSNELPWGIEKMDIKTIVDIHDLCFVRYPKDYSWLDRQVFWFKSLRAAQVSTKIIATSMATKRDIIELLKIPESKIEVVYQCCDSSFYQQLDKAYIGKTKTKYQLPSKYVLCVGTIQGRKNQKSIVEAMAQIDFKKRLPIVLVGQGTHYLDELLALALDKNVEVQIIDQASTADLPAIYQGAEIFIYPSFVEGFGIPVLEAMASQIPVITSINTSMEEIIQQKDALINPNNVNSISSKILSFLKQYPEDLVKKAHQRSLMFSKEKFAREVLAIYENL